MSFVAGRLKRLESVWLRQVYGDGMSTYLGKTPPPGSLLKKGGPRAKGKNSRWREERDGMSEGHLELVRRCPCAICRRTPAGTVHHLKTTGERGLAVRSTDKWGVPLCPVHHDAVERAGKKNELRWFADNGVADVVWLASALWKASGDLPKMTRVVITHKEG